MSRSVSRHCVAPVWLLLTALGACSTTEEAPSAPEGWKLVYAEDFESGDIGLDYVFSDPAAWQQREEDGNSFLEQECLRLHRRLTPFRRLQLKLRGRLRQSMAEHEAIVDALDQGDGRQAESAIRQHVAVQGEKFHHLMASVRTAVDSSGP